MAATHTTVGGDATSDLLTLRRCVVCTAGAPGATVNICTACADELADPLGYVAEQVLSNCVAPLDAALVDRWGRIHRLAASTVVGRVTHATSIAILNGAVSREHAVLTQRRAGVWTVTDQQSTNGTTVNDLRVEGSAVLAHGDRLAFGSVGMYFVLACSDLSEAPTQIASRTVPPGNTERSDENSDGEPDQSIVGGMPTVALQFVEAPSGGGGYLGARGHHVRLTDTQFALLARMARRMLEERDVAEVVRGFVPTGQLIAELPWDAHAPDESHLKQLIRRTRKTLDAAGIGDLIESRRGFGYRLRVVPARTSTGL